MDIMTLAAKLTLDSGAYEKGLKRAEGGMARLGKTLSAKTVALGTFAGNMLTKATSAAFRTLSNVVRSATDAYASYEQLTGGISTLFGTKEINNAKDYAKQIGLISEKVDKAGKTITTVNKKMAKTLFGDKSGKVTGKMTADEIAQRAYEQAEQAQKDAMDNAAKAYKSAGLSMNAYMDTATSLAASMNQATGGDTQKSASLIDMAIRDMADNANKMGTDMSAVENAYKGFAKGNYTMLDNLKLGYGGTKGEMQRLLKDASAITGEKYKIGNMADMVKAINAIQKQQGITGTTEKEAKETIEGSKNMLKASWENVLTALAAPEDLDLSGALTSLTDSAKTYLKNLFPVVSTVVDGLGTFMEQVLPDVMEKLPELIADFAPKLLKAGKKMLEGFGKGLKKVAAKIKMPTWDDVKTAATSAWNKIKEGAKKLGGLIFGQNPDGSIKWPTWDDVKAKAEEAWETIKTGAKALGGLVFGTNPDGSIKWPTWDDVKAKAEEAWETIKTGALELGGLVFGKAEDGTIAWPDVTKLVTDFGTWWSETAVPALTGVMKWTLTLFGMPETTAEGIAETIGTWWNTMVSAAESVLVWALNLPDTPYEAGQQLGEIIGKWWEGIKSYAESALQWMIGLFGIGDSDGSLTLAEIQKWWDETVVPLLTDALNFVLGLFGLPDAKEMATSITTWWEGVKELIGDALTLAVDVLMPEWLKNILLGGKTGNDDITGPNAPDERPQFGEIWEVGNPSGGKSSDSNPAEDFEEVSQKANQAGETGKICGEDIKQGMATAGASANSASTAVESLGEDIAAVEGTHEIKFNITTTGSIPDIDGGGEGGGEGGGSGSHGFAKGLPTVPFDNYIAQLHRGEMVLTKSQARQYREGSSGNMDISGMAASIVAAVREGMAGAQVNSFLSGKKVTDDSNRRTSNMLRARRFATI